MSLGKDVSEIRRAQQLASQSYILCRGIYWKCSLSWFSVRWLFCEFTFGSSWLPRLGIKNCRRFICFCVQKAERGGYKEFVLEITGERVFSKLKYESGVHRVQRVPATESQGRVHTSTATVAIMPEVSTLHMQSAGRCHFSEGSLQNSSAARSILSR